MRNIEHYIRRRFAVFNRSSVVGVLLGAMALVPSGAGAQTVVDAKGKFVGVMYAPEGLGVDWVFRRVSPTSVVSFKVSKSGFHYDYIFPWYFYTTGDCSGQIYMDVPIDALIDKAYFIPFDPMSPVSTKGKLVYANGPSSRLTISSAKNLSNDPPNCEPIDPVLMTVRPLTEQSVSAWGLIAPFKLK